MQLQEWQEQQGWQWYFPEGDVGIPDHVFHTQPQVHEQAPGQVHAQASCQVHPQAHPPAQASGQVHPQPQPLGQTQLADEAMFMNLFGDIDEDVEEELGESHVTTGEQVIAEPAKHDYASMCCAIKFHSDDDTDDETPAISLIDCPIIFN